MTDPLLINQPQDLQITTDADIALANAAKKKGITFFAEGKELLVISAAGFWVRGTRVEQGGGEALAVYTCLKSFLALNGLVGPSGYSEDNPSDLIALKESLAVTGHRHNSYSPLSLDALAAIEDLERKLKATEQKLQAYLPLY